jgi:hypothetical protein
VSIYSCAEAVFGSLSIPAVYTAPSGSPVDCRIILMRSVERFGAMASEAVIQQDEVSFLRAELVAERGATVQADGTTWVVMQRLRDDGAIVRWSVRPA